MSQRRHRLHGLIVAVGLACTAQSAPSGPHFVDDTFADFRAGAPGAGGQNLYVSRDGKVRTIQRFDLNDDGYLDLVFNCTHDTYQMLTATVGTFGPGGRPHSRDLAVEGSQRVATADLNGDGWTDAVFCPNSIGVDHPRRIATIAWGGANGWSSARIGTPLPVNSATAVGLPDLDGDGRRDVALLCGPRWLPQQPEGRILRVYWNGADGFDSTRFADLGVPGGRDLAAADFDGDGSADLAVLVEGGRIALYQAVRRPEPAVRTPEPPVMLDLGLPDATCLVAADATGDARPDLVAGSSGGELSLLAAQPDRQWAPPALMAGFPATHIHVADMDGDRFPDLTLTNFAEGRAAGGEQAGGGRNPRRPVHILWGGPDGHSPQRSLAVPADTPVAAASADLDRDGRLDLVIASHQGRTTFNGTSRVLFQRAPRRFVEGTDGFRTSGTTDVAAVPAERGLPARVLFCNSIGGRLEEAVPVPIFWGGPRGFDPQRALWIPFHSGYEASGADLNEDGRSDLILLNSGHAGESAQSDVTLGANLFWNVSSARKEGRGVRKEPGARLTPHSSSLSPREDRPYTGARRQVLREQFLGTSTVADLNRDGYLDLVLEPFAPEKEGESDLFSLYYGGPDGFTRARRRTLEKEGYGQEHLVADLNGDGVLDIAATTRKHHALRIYWGRLAGTPRADGTTDPFDCFDAGRDQRLPVSGPVGVDAADLNRDGFLDLVVGSYNDPVSGFKDMGSRVFWGSARGYSAADNQWLPGFAPLGRTIADFDGDGTLDLFAPQQSGELTREDLACRLYWGGADGLNTRRFTTLFCDSVNDSMAGDFNGDGRIDLAVSSHTRHGDHRARSRVFYNDGDRFRSPRVQFLPTNGPHLMFATDVGNLYDRRYRETFVSRIFSWDRPGHTAVVRSRAETPPGARLALQLRSAPSPNGLTRAAWRSAAAGRYRLNPADRCLQYRAEFLSHNGSRYPTLDRVEIRIAEAGK